MSSSSTSSNRLQADDFLNSGFLSQDDIGTCGAIGDETTNSLDIEKYFLETTCDNLDDIDAKSITRCVYVHAANSNIHTLVNYSPINSAYNSPPSHFTCNKYESPLAKINEASFDLSDSCFLCTTNNINDEEYFTTSNNGEETATNLFDDHYLQVSSITEYTTKNTLESLSIEKSSIQRASGIEQMPISLESVEIAESLFKRNESGRVSCKSIYSYLIKPIKNKFKLGNKCKQSKVNKPLNEIPKPTQIFNYKSSTKQQRQLNEHRQFSNKMPLHKPSSSQTGHSAKYETVFQDKNNLKLASNPNQSLALADQFHNCGDLVYYLV